MKKHKETANRIITYLNDLTGRRYRPIKSNQTPIITLLDDEFTEEEIKAVIQLKVLQWINNPTMSPYLRPSTLFRYNKFQDYVNELIAVKQNPELYKKHYEEINRKNAPKRSAADEFDAMFNGKQ